MDNIFLSLIIPSKNREFTLTKVLLGILSEKSLNFEVVVSDNSDKKINLPQDILSDIRLKYVHTTQNLSMRDNCSKAVDLARGDFLIMIGDDDYVDVPQALSTIKSLEARNFDFALSPSNNFYWPNLKRKFFSSKPFGFEQSRSTSHNEKIIFPIAEFKKVLARGGCSIGLMPRLYQGLVRRSCVLKLKEITGHVFNAPTPDMSSSVGLSFICRAGILVKSHFIINGVSSDSGGGKGAAGKHSGLINDAYGLTAEDKALWPSFVRPLWTGGTVWAASFILTLLKLDKFKEFENKFNLAAIDGYLIAFNFKLAFKYLRFNFIYPSSIKIAFTYFIQRMVSLVRNFFVYTKLTIGWLPKFNSIVEYYDFLKSKKIRL